MRELGIKTLVHAVTKQGSDDLPCGVIGLDQQDPDNLLVNVVFPGAERRLGSIVHDVYYV